MLPFLHIGNLALPVYGLMLATAILSTVWIAVDRAPAYGIDRNFGWCVSGVAVLSAVIGGKLGDFAIHPGWYRNSPGELLHTSGTFLFGFLAATLSVAALGFHFRTRVSAWSIGDCLAPSVALGIAIARLGCFAAGCDYGKPTNLPWAVTFTNPVAAQIGGVPLGIPLHPSQLYESLYSLAVFFLLLWFSRKPRSSGATIWLFAICYFAGRFLLEFLRGDVNRGFWGPFSTSQWLSLVLFILFLLLYQIPALHGSRYAASLQAIRTQ